MGSPRVVLADDHPGVAEAMGEYVAEAFQLVGTVIERDCHGRGGTCDDVILRWRLPASLLGRGCQARGRCFDRR